MFVSALTLWLLVIILIFIYLFKDALVGTSSGSMAVSNSINFTSGLSGNNHRSIQGREAD